MSVYFPLLVQNESALADSFTTHLGEPGGPGGPPRSSRRGGVRVPVQHAGDAARIRRFDIEVKIYDSAGATFGTYISRVHAVSRTDNRVSESVTAAVSVSDAGQLDMLIDGSGRVSTARSGRGSAGSSDRNDRRRATRRSFSVELRNLSGSEQRSISRGTRPPAGASRSTAGRRRSPDIPSGIYELKVVVPSSASTGGTFDIIVDGPKTDRRFYVDSVRGPRLRDHRPMVVDAVIDGNGNGLYGPLGTRSGAVRRRRPIGTGDAAGSPSSSERRCRGGRLHGHVEPDSVVAGDPRGKRGPFGPERSRAGCDSRSSLSRSIVPPNAIPGVLPRTSSTSFRTRTRTWSRASKPASRSSDRRGRISSSMETVAASSARSVRATARSRSTRRDRGRRTRRLSRSVTSGLTPIRSTSSGKSPRDGPRPSVVLNDGDEGLHESVVDAGRSGRAARPSTR